MNSGKMGREDDNQETLDRTQALLHPGD